MGGALDPALARVRGAVRAALADLPPGGAVLVACSGGADSLALAAAAAFEAPRAGLRAGAVVVDHQLQPGSGEVAAAAAYALAGLGLAPVAVQQVAVGEHGGPEAAARTARYAALSACADAVGAPAVLLGHTRDDQAETVLLGLARGSGARSLAGMRPVDGRWRRPLLDVDRAECRRACLAAGLVPWDDPHNGSAAYARVRVRAQALPALEDALGPGVAGALARTARLLQQDADALDAWAARALDEASDGDGLDVAALAALPAAVRTRVLRRAALAAGCPAGELALSHVDAVDALVTRWRGQGPLDLPGGVRARRRCGRVSLDRALPG
ncbi:tRNA(Ile)-lysidine synthase [Motilibacter rhizosphaerae]|uniref:tRNA(Ile)-lysidine synthase n=1 Tax=Motilibacter rhizosphaerae TaxID=598652 RepID=A0A4Q7NAJ3_9ACTN|nr:tRNA lysidine(34) synthetase TilS [Motilibacter rhizosphaerae]RZS79427.1 tRNA(Ile)-lysidine synthase [Motilibacter rhizosphaerae]